MSTSPAAGKIEAVPDDAVDDAQDGAQDGAQNGAQNGAAGPRPAGAPQPAPQSKARTEPKTAAPAVAAVAPASPPASTAELEAKAAAALRQAEEAAERAAQMELKVSNQAKAAQKLRDKITQMEQRDEEDPASRGKGIKGRVAVAPPVAARRMRKRHVAAIFSFFLFVAAPVAGTGWYLWERAVDRYVSTAGFSVRKEEAASAFDLLGGLASLAGSSSGSDTDILYRFIQSQELVRIVDNQLDLRALWAKADPAIDPVFSYHPPGTIEDLLDYWLRMVNVYNDSGTGLIDIQVQAFAPEDAQAIAQLIYDESSRMINELSAVAQADATRFSREELDDSVERLKDARAALTLFRNETQIVDPLASVQSQMGLLSSLEGQLAETLIDLDILRQTTADSDPRIVQAQRRVEVIEARMQDERDKLGISAGSGPGGSAFADLVGEYERLAVDVEFAQQSYVAALAAYDAAVSETRKQSRYLAAHVRPTLAERSDQPERLTLLALVALFSFLTWAILVLAAYALKDRR